MMSSMLPSPCASALTLSLLFSLLITGAHALTNRALIKGATMCERVGVPDWERYETSLLVTSNNATTRAPLFASHSLDPRNNTDIRVAMIMIHGGACDGNHYFCSALTSFNSTDTIVVSPLFTPEPLEEDDWSPAPTDDLQYMFVPAGWDNSVNVWQNGKGQLPFGSYAVVDAIIRRLKDKARFPRLQQITVAGFSKGGTFVQLYSYWTSFGEETKGTRVRFSWGDPGNYHYFDNLRPYGEPMAANTSGPCTAPYGTTAIPNCTFTRDADLEDCSSFLQQTAGWSPSQDIESYTDWEAYLEGNVSVVRAKVKSFMRKTVLAVLGADDVCNCQMPGFMNEPPCFTNYPPYNNTRYRTCPGSLYKYCCDTIIPDYTFADAVSMECGPLLTGRTRFERGMIFLSYMMLKGGRSYTPNYAIIPNMSHESEKYVKSDELKSFVRGEA